MAGFFLELRHALAHVVEQAQGQRVAKVAGDVFAAVREVAHHLVDAVHAQRAEVVAQRAQIPLGVGEQALVHQPLDEFALGLQALLAQFHQAVERGKQAHFIARMLIAQPRAVDGDHAQAARLLGAAEEAVAALQKLAQIQLQAAAHGPHHVGLQLRVHKVLEIRQAVLGRHVEQQLRVLTLPREILGDVVRGDGEGEHAALGIARGHHVDVGAVDEVHLGLQIAVGEGHFFTCDHGHLLAQIFGAGPVEGEVGERRLRAPARGHVEVVDQLLNALAHGGVVHGIFAHKRRHVGVERRERLRARPLVLQRAQKVHDLPHGRTHVLGRPRLHLAGHAVQALVQQRAQRPARAVAAEHVEVVDVDVAIAVRLADLRRVHVRQPVVGRDLARHVQDQPAQRVALVGIRAHAPVGAREVFVDGAFHIHQRLLVRPQRGVLLAVDDVGARRGQVVGGDQRLLGHVLDLLHRGRLAMKAVDQHLGDLRGEQRGFFGAIFPRGLARAGQCGADAFCVKRNALTAAQNDLAGQGDKGGCHGFDQSTRWSKNTTYGVHDTHQTL